MLLLLEFKYDHTIFGFSSSCILGTILRQWQKSFPGTESILTIFHIPFQTLYT
jgi:hypothetical protein